MEPNSNLSGQPKNQTLLTHELSFCHREFSRSARTLESILSPLADIARPTIRSARPFAASVQIFHLGIALLILKRSPPFRFGRSRAKARRDGLDHYFFYMPQSRGTAFIASDVVERLRRLDLVVADLAHPLDIIVGPGAGVGLVLPRLRLAPLLGEADTGCARLLAAESPGGALLGRHLLALARHASNLPAGNVRGFAEATALLASTCIAGAVRPLEPPATCTVPRGLGSKARDLIERNLHDSRLNAEAVAHDLHISRTQLYRQFERAGGVHHYIRDRRLHRALGLISRLDAEPRRISDIAFSLGFVSEAHFSRLFRERFGLSPRSARMAARRGDSPNPGGPDGFECNPLERWLRELSVA